MQSFSRCNHKGITRIMQIGKATIFAGNVQEVEETLDEMRPQAVISAMGEDGEAWLTTPVVKLTPKAWSRFPTLRQVQRKKYTPDTRVVIDWPDGFFPDLGIGWWKALAHDLAKLKGRVVIFCMGGHGRTGTALTILAALTGANGRIDPVEWIRARYCREAVESKYQLDYLDSLGIKTEARPSDPPFAKRYVQAAQTGPVAVTRGKQQTIDDADDDAREDAEDEEKMKLLGRMPRRGDCIVCEDPNGAYIEEFDAYACTDCEKALHFSKGRR